MSNSFASIAKTLGAKVVGPIFKQVSKKARRDESLPEIVYRNRFNRAQQRLANALASRGSKETPRNLRREVKALVSKWAEKGFSDAFEEIEQFEIERAKEYELVKARASGDLEEIRRVLENEYREEVFRRHGRIELRGVQTAHRVWQDLEDFYIPLHVSRPPHVSPDTDDEQVRLFAGLERTPVVEALRERGKILIVGAPGSGKSTLISYLASQCARRKLHSELGWDDDPLPVPYIVRETDETSFAQKSLARAVGFDPNVLEPAIASGRAVLLIDGLDEAPEARRKKLLASLKRLLELHPRLRVVATSRPAAVESEKVDFLTPFQLDDFSPQEVDQFVDSWCLAAESSVQTSASVAKRIAATAAADLKRRVVRNRSVRRLMANPLLSNIVCTVHRFLGQKIPEHRAGLYEKCLDALLYEWDRSKFDDDALIGKLDAVEKRKLLSGLAWRMHERHDAEVSEEEVRRHFEETLPKLGHPAREASEVVKNIKERTGVLVEGKPGVFGFSHLTFQEYLAAKDAVEQERLTELVANYQDPWWHETIVLAAGLAGSHANTIVSQVLARKGVKAVLVAAACLETALEIDVELREEVEANLEVLLRNVRVNFSSLQEVAELAAPAMLRLLPSADGADVPFIMNILAGAEYEPAIPQLGRMIADIRPTGVGLHGEDDEFPLELDVGESASFFLGRLVVSNNSALAQRELEKALFSRDWDKNLLERFHEAFVKRGGNQRVLALLIKALKAQSPAVQSRRASRSTARSRRSKAGPAG